MPACIFTPDEPTLSLSAIEHIFYYKTSILLCNCFLFPYFYLLQSQIHHRLFTSPVQTIKSISHHISAGCIMTLRLRSPRHHAPDFRFLSHYTQGRHTSFGGILASLPPRFPTQPLTACAPFLRTYRIPSASLRERSYASVAPQPLPAASTFPLPFQSTFSQNFLFRAVAQVLSNRLLL